MKIIICGSRSFNNYDYLEKAMDSLLVKKLEQGEPIIIVSGMARGADSIGVLYAKRKGFQYEAHPANWERDGKGAGFLRNEVMVSVSDALVAFWDGTSKGTADTIGRAQKKGIPVRVFKYGEQS